MSQKCYHIAMNLPCMTLVLIRYVVLCNGIKSLHFAFISTQSQYDCTASSDHFVSSVLIYISHLQQPAKFSVKWTFLRSSKVRVSSRCFVKRLPVVNFVVCQILVNNWSLYEIRSILINPYPTAFPYGNGMVLHLNQQQESSTTKTVHKVINKGLKTYV